MSAQPSRRLDEGAPTPRAGSACHPGDCAPYYAADAPDLYHTRLDCPLGAAVPEAVRRVDQALLIRRLPFW